MTPTRRPRSRIAAQVGSPSTTSLSRSPFLLQPSGQHNRVVASGRRGLHVAGHTVSVVWNPGSTFTASIARLLPTRLGSAVSSPTSTVARPSTNKPRANPRWPRRSPPSGMIVPGRVSIQCAGIVVGWPSASSRVSGGASKPRSRSNLSGLREPQQWKSRRLWDALQWGPKTQSGLWPSALPGH